MLLCYVVRSEIAFLHHWLARASSQEDLLHLLKSLDLNSPANAPMEISFFLHGETCQDLDDLHLASPQPHLESTFWGLDVLAAVP